MENNYRILRAGEREILLIIGEDNTLRECSARYGLVKKGETSKAIDYERDLNRDLIGRPIETEQGYKPDIVKFRFYRSASKIEILQGPKNAKIETPSLERVTKLLDKMGDELETESYKERRKERRQRLKRD